MEGTLNSAGSVDPGPIGVQDRPSQRGTDMADKVDVLAVLDPKESQIVSGREWRFVRKDVRPMDVPVAPYAVGSVPTISKLRACWLFESTLAYMSLDAEEPPPQAIVDATRLAEARDAVAELIEAAEGLRFDVFELTTPELRTMFDGHKQIAVVHMETVRHLRAALASVKGN
jgi:hypothetical protein